jgi:hypothetical protein
MQTALILGYQKSVDLRTPSRLHKSECATGNLDEIFDEATGRTPQTPRHGLACIGRPISGTPV